MTSRSCGTPISLRNTTFDNDRNGSTQNEYLAAGTYTGAGPGYAQADLRAGYRIQLGGGRTLDAFLDVFNLANRANFANPSADQRLPATFLRLLDVRDEGPTRTAKINVRYGFSLMGAAPARRASGGHPAQSPAA